VSKPSDRDRSVERLLGAARQSSLTRAAERTADCADADVIAAWVDGSLSASEARALETHLAGCAYCQAVLATLGQMTRADAPPTPWWRRWFMLVPIAAAVAATVLVVLKTTAPSPIAPASPPAVAQVVGPSQPQLQTREVALPPASAPTGQEQPRPPAARVVEEQKAQAVAVPEPKPVAPPPAAVTAPPPPAAPPPITPVPVAAAPSAAVSELSLAGGVLADFTSPDSLSSSTADATASNRGGGGGGGRGGGRVAGGAGALRSSTVVESPMRWQILTTGAVRRSPDRGASWQPVAIDVAVTVATGAAPSRLVCWLAGRRGVVLLSIDGQTFTRVDLPEPLDIASVRAQNALSATVVTVTGREFSTADGGHSWR